MTFSDPRPSKDASRDPVAGVPHEAPQWRKWWHDDDNPEQDLLHRMLIASPWERYLLDRDAAEPDEGSARF